MTTTNGGQQGAGQTLGNALGQSMPFGTQSMGQGQPQAMGGQQQLDPQFLGALLPIIATVAQGVISQLNAPQGQPQAAMGGQQQGVSPQFLPGIPGFPFLPTPSPGNVLRGVGKIGEGIGDFFGLSAQPGQPQAGAGGQQQIDPQFFELVKFLPGLIEPVVGMIKQLSAQTGQPSFAQPQGVKGGAAQPMATAGWR